MSYAVIAFIIGVVFFVVEIFTFTFVMSFFGIGAWAAALYLAFGTNFSIALGIFCVTSLLSLFFLRKFLIKTFQGVTKSSKDNAPEFIHTGKHALVNIAIPANDFGQVELNGSFWRATATKDIAVGKKIVVLGQVDNDEISLKVQELE